MSNHYVAAERMKLIIEILTVPLPLADVALPSAVNSTCYRNTEGQTAVRRLLAA
jgi:hypothetical protein